MAGEQLRVAAAQLPAHPLAEAEASLASIQRAIEQAADAGADLLVLPECAYPAYLLGSVEQYRQADVLSADDFVILLARQARKKKLHIVSGYVEDLGTHLHNSAVLIDAQGQTVGCYRKSFLWANDNDWFRPGDRVPVFPTALGAVGVVICADTRAPEILAKLAIERAQVVAMPTCWINTARDGGFENPQPEYLISARAKEFAIPFVCANKFGKETDSVGYCGRSVIVSAAGEVLEEAPGDQETLIVKELSLRDPDRQHSHDELWESLLAWEHAVRPTLPERVPIRMAVWPGESVSAAALERLAADDVTLVVANGLADDDPGAGLSIGVILPEHVGAVRRTGSGKLACIKGEDVLRFSRTRLLALGGAELVCVFEAPDDLKLLRTRAVENRIFIVALNHSEGTLVSPAGEVLGHVSYSPGTGFVTDLDLAEAAHKEVAPGTDIWEQRRVRTYK